jgi:hypothetical protein
MRRSFEKKRQAEKEERFERLSACHKKGGTLTAYLFK